MLITSQLNQEFKRAILKICENKKMATQYKSQGKRSLFDEEFAAIAGVISPAI